MKILKVKYPINWEENDLLILNIEDSLNELNITMLKFDIIENKNDIEIILSKWNNVKWLNDFIEEWKILKNIWIKNNIFNNTNYANFFKINDIENTNNTDDNIQMKTLDKLLVKVDKDDSKIVDILEQLKKKTK